MPRVKRGVKARRRRKRLLNLAEGYRGRRKNCYTVSIIAVERGLQHAYKGRKNKKRDFRSLWIQRISAACKARGISYSKFMFNLKQAGVTLNRKMLSQLAATDPKGFDQVFELTQKAA